MPTLLQRESRPKDWNCHWKSITQIDNHRQNPEPRTSRRPERHHRPWKFIVGAFGMRGFHKKVDRFAKQYGERDPADLIARYRELATSRIAPPVIGPIAPLTDIVVHALDIQRPLDLPATSDERATLIALEALCGGFPGFTPKKLIADLRFEATDLDWSLGDGPPVKGTTADLILGVMGRPTAAEALDGEGAAILRERL